MRVFKSVCFIVIDDQEAILDGVRDGNLGEATLEEVQNYLKDALVIDVDTENVGNEIGFQSAEIIWSDLVELSDKERIQLYGE